MGFRLAELFVQITGQDQGLRRTLASAHQGLLGLASQAGALGALGVFGAAGTLTAALGVTAKVAIDLEQKFVALQKATDVDSSGLQALKAELYGLSTTLAGVSLENLVEIATTGAKMGIAAGDLGKYAQGIAKVASAMDDIPAQQVADQIGKVNVVFKLGVDGAMQLGSAIDKLADSGVSSSSGILAVTQRLSGTAAAAKLSASDTTALAAALLDTGTQAELGASALGRLIQALSDVDSQKDFAKVLGKDVKSFAAQVKAGPMDAIQDFLGALKKLDAGSQAEALKGIGFEGVQGIGEIQKLAQQVDTLRDYAGKARHEFETLDQVNKSYGASSSTLGAKLTQVKNVLLILADKVGTALMPPIRVGLNLLSGLTTALTTYFDNLVIGYTNLAGRFGQFPAIVDSAFGEGTVGSIRALVDQGLAYVTEGLDLFGVYVRNFPDFFDIFVLYGTQAFMNLGEVIATLPGNLAIIGDYVARNWSRLIVDGVNIAITSFRNLSDNLAKLGLAIVGFLKDPTKGFDFQWNGLTDGFKATAEQLPTLIKPSLTSLQDAIDDKFNEIGRREAKAKQAASLPRGSTKDAKAAAGEAEGEFAGTKKKDKGSVSDLAGFAKSLQEAVSGKDKAADRTAKATERSAKALEELARKKDQPNPGVAFGPGWQAAGIA